MPLKNILLVDDDYIAITLNKMLLQHMKVTDRITTFNNGKEALNFIKTECFESKVLTDKDCVSLVLLDVNMPVMSGDELLKELEHFKNRGFTVPKIVILSASDHPRNTKLMHDFEVFDFIVKPLTEDKVNNLLSKVSHTGV
jgi:CheY-like chemotaxis protein